MTSYISTHLLMKQYKPTRSFSSPQAPSDLQTNLGFPQTQTPSLLVRYLDMGMRSVRNYNLTITASLAPRNTILFDTIFTQGQKLTGFHREPSGPSNLYSQAEL